MNIRFHKDFEKQYKKLQKKKKDRFKETIQIFFKDEFDPILNNHALKGKYKGYRSINVTGDLRAVYKRLVRDRAVFIAIDSHSNLYK
ncbi:MAG: type II toxin-antitoxin system YafQ family toxin [Candidatus Nealsonbacteria bacterium]